MKPFGKFLVVLVAMFLFTQEVEGWRRVRKFFRNVGTIVNRSFGNIGRFVSRFQSSINSSKSQTTNTDSKSSSSNEKEGGRVNPQKTLETVGKVVKGVTDLIGVFSLLGKRSTVQETSRTNFCEFTAFDLDKNMQVTEDEIDRLIEVTGLIELDKIFENLDMNKDNAVTIEEFYNSPVIVEICN
ncbi:uncharacterized protein LOC111118378 [Crassostrea virginica]|uniref:Uncharacterized protein LOC111118378 n=1 Tax=Crassostrea virginica TaxID=6565 RepID=A0A8B8CCU7_CRAVI|nr:uncharacterized protein LOC111118378 [Crassostrea virginica]